MTAQIIPFRRQHRPMAQVTEPAEIICLPYLGPHTALTRMAFEILDIWRDMFFGERP